MFTVSAIFLPQLYYSDKVGTCALQKIIEEPQLYLLGISSSNTKSEESFREARLQDLATLSGSLTSPSGLAAYLGRSSLTSYSGLVISGVT